jgi:signal transduction histidine kinase
MQYSGEGRVIIRLENIDDATVQFSIADEGVGISQNELYDIFGEFVISSKTKTLAERRGLGLAIYKKAIELQGGKIYAKSNGVKGREFIFTLPL